jgi:hypothetical protein
MLLRKPVSLFVVVAAVVLVLAVPGCSDLLGSSGGGGNNSSNTDDGTDQNGDDATSSDGTLTISVTGADAHDGATLLAGVFAHGVAPESGAEPLAYSDSEVIAGGSASAVLYEDGSGTSQAWQGTGGETYDAYVFIDVDDDGEPSYGDYAHNSQPLTYIQDGDHSIATEFSDYVEQLSGDDGDDPTTAEGTVTVTLSSADPAEGQHLYAFAYDEGQTDLGAANVLATNNGEIVSGEVSFTLKVDDGSWLPTDEDWQAEIGATYDLYIYTTGDTESYDFDGTSRVTEEFPLHLTVQGNESIDLTYLGLDYAYTLTVSISGAENLEGEALVAAVFPQGTDLATDPEPLAVGSATISSGEASFLAQYPPAEGSWLATAGECYDVYMFVDTDDNGEPSLGDWVYDSNGVSDLEARTYTQAGNLVLSAYGDDFIEYNGIPSMPSGWQYPIRFAEGTKVTSLAAEDLNDNGRASLFTANTSEQIVEMWYHNATQDSFFSEETTDQFPGDVHDIILGDFQGDGSASSDIVAAVRLSGVHRSTWVSGSGYGTPEDLTVGNSYGQLVAGPVDFNDDGYLDFVANQNQEFRIYYGTSEGTFVTDRNPIAADSSSPNGSTEIPCQGALFPVDMDGDSDLDLVGIWRQGGWTHYDSDRSDYFLRGFENQGQAGDSNFVGWGVSTSEVAGHKTGDTTGTGYTMNTARASAAVGDFNEDGFMDMTVSDDTGPRHLLCLATHVGTNLTDWDEQTLAEEKAYLQTADVDGDGRTDIISCGSSHWNGLKIYYGNGDGTFDLQEFDLPYGTGAEKNGAVIADFDGNGAPDIATAFYDDDDDQADGVVVFMQE